MSLAPHPVAASYKGALAGACFDPDPNAALAACQALRGLPASAVWDVLPVIQPLLEAPQATDRKPTRKRTDRALVGQKGEALEELLDLAKSWRRRVAAWALSVVVTKRGSGLGCKALSVDLAKQTAVQVVIDPAAAAAPGTSQEPFLGWGESESSGKETTEEGQGEESDAEEPDSEPGEDKYDPEEGFEAEGGFVVWGPHSGAATGGVLSSAAL